MKAINQSFIKRRKNWTTIIKEDRWDNKQLVESVTMQIADGQVDALFYLESIAGK